MVVAWCDRRRMDRPATARELQRKVRLPLTICFLLSHLPATSMPCSERKSCASRDVELAFMA